MSQNPMSEEQRQALVILRSLAFSYEEKSRNLAAPHGAVSVGMADRQAGMTGDCLHALLDVSALSGVEAGVEAALSQANAWIRKAKEQRGRDAQIGMAPPVSIIEIEARKLRAAGWR